MAAKILTNIITAANLAAWKVAFDIWAAGGYVIIGVNLNDAQTSGIIYYYA